MLLNKVGTVEDVEWNIGEFFIIAKFQNKGIGKKVAHLIFDKFPGLWEVAVMPNNEKGLVFWDKVIGNYTANNFTKALKIVNCPEPHPMMIYSFYAGN